MEAVRVPLILRLDEIYKRLSITANLLNKIHITDDPGVCESFHRILKAHYRGDQGEFAGKPYLSQLLVHMFIGYACFGLVPSRKVRRPPACCCWIVRRGCLG